MGRDPEEMAELCDIAMEGDRAVGASFDAFEFTLGETIAQGCPACRSGLTRSKNNPDEKDPTGLFLCAGAA